MAPPSKFPRLMVPERLRFAIGISQSGPFARYRLIRNFIRAFLRLWRCLSSRSVYGSCPALFTQVLLAKSAGKTPKRPDNLAIIWPISCRSHTALANWPDNRGTNSSELSRPAFSHLDWKGDRERCSCLKRRRPLARKAVLESAVPGQGAARPGVRVAGTTVRGVSPYPPSRPGTGDRSDNSESERFPGGDRRDRAGSDRLARARRGCA